MGVFVAEVRPRWSDMDAFGHVNHASLVTILEEARVALLFEEAVRRGVTELGKGVVVAKLSIEYRAPLVVDGSAVRIELAVRDLRAASFAMDYTVISGRGERARTVATAHTLIAPYDLEQSSPRRLSDAERDFLAGWLAETPGRGSA
ncbi:acyl-CoA thioesterase [Sciscionella sediminilitoris]|uniref:acyl-CoA thioesterase n=1 Tax=Sciscionella sediminilitoris TaxID=1445613 RepID=UPI0004DFA643|nr:thioesterase family protein [Sciscionella sp. SE31]